MTPRHKRTDFVDKASLLKAAGELRDLLCREARHMIIWGPLYAAHTETLHAIDNLATALGEPEAFTSGTTPPRLRD